MVQQSCLVDRKIGRSPCRVNVCLNSAELPKRHLSSVGPAGLQLSQPASAVVGAYALQSLNVKHSYVVHLYGIFKSILQTGGASDSAKSADGQGKHTAKNVTISNSSRLELYKKFSFSAAG